jgi:hypothetical protein
MTRVVAALLLLLALPVRALAQSGPAREPGPLPVEIRRGQVPPEAKVGRLIVRPPALDPSTVREAMRALVEFEQARRAQQLLRGEAAAPARRPDLGSDVTGAIQQRNLQRAPPR